jgi:hypothetical protein
MDSPLPPQTVEAILSRLFDQLTINLHLLAKEAEK